MKSKSLNLTQFKNSSNTPVQELKNSTVLEKKVMLSFYIDERLYNRLNYNLAENRITFGEWVTKNFLDYVHSNYEVKKQEKQKGEIKRSVPIIEHIHCNVKSKLKLNGLTFRDLIYNCINEYISK